jgi:hypothetical protein
MNNHEYAILSEAKASNPYWFKAIVKAAEIINNRNAKYNGNSHPYKAFSEFASYEPLMEDWKIFANMLKIKFARLNGSANDFSDESLIDTFLDLANYSLMGAGWIMNGKMSLIDLYNDITKGMDDLREFSEKFAKVLRKK